MNSILRTTEIEGLVSIAQSLNLISRRLPALYHKVNGDDFDMEDCAGYVETQDYIAAAIHRISEVIGDRVAEGIIR